MRPNESGTTRVSMSRTIASLNDLRIFVTRSSADSITFDTIRKRSKPCFIPFFKMDVELFMRTYIAQLRNSRRVQDDGGLNQLAQMLPVKNLLALALDRFPRRCGASLKEAGGSVLEVSLHAG